MKIIKRYWSGNDGRSVEEFSELSLAFSLLIFEELSVFQKVARRSLEMLLLRHGVTHEKTNRRDVTKGSPEGEVESFRTSLGALGSRFSSI